MRAAPLALLALLSALAGCAPETYEKYRKSWQRVELPGFSIELPPGKVVATSDVPSTGKYQREIKASLIDHWFEDIAINGNVAASWSTQSSTFEEWRDDYLPLYMAGLVSAVPGSKLIKVEKLSENSWYAVMGTDRVPLAAGAVRCEADFQVEVVYTHYHDVAREAADIRELLKSVRCAVGAQNRATTRVATRLPAKFGSVSVSNPQSYHSLDGEDLAVNFTAGDVTRDPKILRVIVRQLAAQGYGVTIEDSALREVTVPHALHLERNSLFSVRLPDEKGTIYVGTAYCETVKLSLISLWTAPMVSDQLAVERFSQVGCPDTPSTPTPTYDSLVESACAGGDAAACAVRKKPAS